MTDSVVRVLDHNAVFVGVLPASVRWTQRLLGAHTLDSVTIPAEYLRQDGTKESRLAYIDDGWQLLFEGGRYIIEETDGDEETGLTITARSAERELGNFYTNYSPGPGTYLNRTPTQIMDALLAGRIGRRLRNPGFGILDSGNLPTNWTHPTGWTAPLVSNRRVWQADAGSDESVSDQIRCALGEKYRVSVSINAPVGMAGTAGILLRWQLADGTTVDSTATNVTPSGVFATVITGEITALGNRCYIVLKTTGTDQVVQFDDALLYEIGPDTGWTYTGSMDTRAASIPYTDGAIAKYGVWTAAGGSLNATVAGDYIGRAINGPFVTVGWAAGGAGATCLVRINGVRYMQSGATLVPGSTPIDVSGALSLTASGLDPANDHLVEVEVVATATKVTGFTVSTVNLISMRWDFKNVLEALDSIVKAVGGELVFDTVAKTITHTLTAGVDLRATNVLEFRRGVNVVKLGRGGDRRQIANRVTGLGYGQGDYQLVVTVNATGLNADGVTSQSLYGVQRGVYENKDARDLATFTAEVQRACELSAFEKDSYSVEVTDAVAALCSPGDVGHFVYKSRNLSLRILEIKRSNAGGKATLIVGNRAEGAGDVVRGVRRQLATLQRSYQGVPADSNDSFSEQFDRTAGGVDHAAEIPFFVPYGADLLDLRLRYQVGGMRNFATAASSGGGSTSSSESTPSGGGSAPTSAAGGGGTQTSTAPSSDTSGASTKTTSDVTSGSTTYFPALTVPTAMRSLVNYTTWYEVNVTAVPAVTWGNQYGAVSVANYGGGARTFNWEMRTAAGGGGSLLASGTFTSLANGACATAFANITAGSSVYFRVQQTTTSAANFLFNAALTCTQDVGPHLGNHGHGMAHTHTLSAHAHNVTYPTHQHSVTIPAHTHSAHSHTVYAHTHGLDYGIYESATPATIRVYLDGTLITALNDQTVVSDFDLLPYIGKDSMGRVAEGWHTLSFKTATNGATGSVRGTLFSQRFLSTESI